MPKLLRLLALAGTPALARAAAVAPGAGAAAWSPDVSSEDEAGAALNMLQFNSGCVKVPEVVTQVSSEDEAGGGLGLLQFTSGPATAHQDEVASEAGSLSAEEATTLVRYLEARGLGGAPPTDINCTEHQTLCEAPFNCQTVTQQEQWGFALKPLATEDGHSNLRTWCSEGSFPHENGIAKQCIQGHDLKGSAQYTYDLQVSSGIGEIDGSYCFIEGHCVDTHVTYDTTVEEAEALCDDKYGHENWTAVKSTDALEIGLRHPLAMSPFTGFHGRDLPRFFGMMACAMGNYHCDVVYCRDTYCKNPHYVERYGHYLEEYGWA